MKNKILTITAVFAIVAAVSGQQKKTYKEKKGDKYAFSYSFDKAV